MWVWRDGIVCGGEGGKHVGPDEMVREWSDMSRGGVRWGGGLVSVR